MKAVGEYALVRIDETTTTSGIQVKNDGVGICVSCPSMPDLENKQILFSTKEEFVQHENVYVMHTDYILAVLE